jgi:hypothetical protein
MPSDELLEVRRRRYQEARSAGLSIAEARLFADGDQDVGTLRRLVAGKCPPDLIALIVV